MRMSEYSFDCTGVQGVLCCDLRNAPMAGKTKSRHTEACSCLAGIRALSCSGR